MKGIVPLEELKSWYQTWNRKILPQNVRIMGGEPLLHPDLEDIVEVTRFYWPDSTVELITNGLLVNRITPELLDSMKRNCVTATVSRHFDDPHYDKLYSFVLEKFEQAGIPCTGQMSVWNWMKCYRIDEMGRAMPYQSDPQKAWKICYVRNLCATLINNKLYRCPQLGCYSYACEMGFVSDDWKTVLDYQPLTPECTAQEIEDFMNREACPQCSICPETFEYADMYEKLNPFGIINKISGQREVKKCQLQ
jgi:hypothetical protein